MVTMRSHQFPSLVRSVLVAGAPADSLDHSWHIRAQRSPDLVVNVVRFDFLAGAEVADVREQNTAAFVAWFAADHATLVRFRWIDSYDDSIALPDFAVDTSRTGAAGVSDDRPRGINRLLAETNAYV